MKKNEKKHVKTGRSDKNTPNTKKMAFYRFLNPP